MQRANCKMARRARARHCFMRWMLLVVGFAFAGSAAMAAPFAYVSDSNGISIIDTATDTVTATAPAGGDTLVVGANGKQVYSGAYVLNTATNTDTAVIAGGGQPEAATPDGTQLYTLAGNDIVVVDTASNSVAATVALPAGSGTPNGIAISEDGLHAYVTSYTGPDIVVTGLDTATYAVLGQAQIASFGPSDGVAITPDGTRVYVTSVADDSVSVLDTSNFTLVTQVYNGRYPLGVTISPDGTRAYVVYLGFEQSEVSVLDTATNTQLTSVPLPAAYPANPGKLAVTPDGKTLYVLTEYGVSVIDTGSETVVTSLPLPDTDAIGIIPSIPFASMRASLAIESSQSASSAVFEIESSFTLARGSSAIDPASQPVILQIGHFAATVPSGSFIGSGNGPWSFVGAIDGVALRAEIARTGAKRYRLVASGKGADFDGIANPIIVRLSVGVDSGTTLTRGLIIDPAHPVNRSNPGAGASLTLPHG